MAKRTPSAKASPKPAATAPAGDAERTLHLSLLRSMLLQRRFEERCAEAYAIGRIGGFCHLYIGQEAVSTGTLSHLRPDDYVITTYRDHGQALARGMTPRSIMAELFGRIDGCAGGKGGSMHMFDKATGFLGGHGIVGGHLPIATGVGFAIKYRGGDQCIVCFFGEAAVNNGAFHESLNMAALWKLPVIFIIENNRYGMGTSIERASSTTDFYHRGAAHGIPGEAVDGMNVLAVRAAGIRAVDHARPKGPYILEMQTYRYRGHSMSDPAKYRQKEEVEKMRTQHDPIESHAKFLIDGGFADEAALKNIDREVKDIATKAAEFAQNSPEPPVSELYTDVLLEVR
jgi:pyruvate dehydrogenase E1 component alpha subunit